MTIYISIPISGLDEKKQREKADRIKIMLSKMGNKPISPFDIYAGKNAKYGQQLGSDIAVLIDYCDAIYLCEGWHNSSGCKIEHFVAETLKKKIIFEHREEPQAYWR